MKPIRRGSVLVALSASLALSACAGKHKQDQETPPSRASEQPGQVERPQAGARARVATPQGSAANAGSPAIVDSNTRIGETRVVDRGTETVETRQRVTVARRSELPTVETRAVRADINRMNEDNFKTVGFPAELAKRIVDFRQQQGQFRSVDQLRQVPGMDQALLERLQPKLGVAPAG